MENTLLLCQVAKLHQRDVEKEIASREIVNQVQAARPGLGKRLATVSESLMEKLVGLSRRRIILRVTN